MAETDRLDHGAFGHVMRSHGISADDSAFSEPWEARVFAILFALAQSRAVEWEDFRQRLIERIAVAERENKGDDAQQPYYESWLQALEELLNQSGLASKAEVEQRAEDIAMNPPTPTRMLSAGPIKIA